MTRWEYMLLDIGVARFWLGPQLDGDAVTERLNELGKRSIELCAFRTHSSENSFQLSEPR